MDEMTDSQALHRTVLLTEAADEVSRARNGIFIDATFGRGGHSRYDEPDADADLR